MDANDRKALEIVRDELAVGETRLYEHVSATFRWLMATLFAANGGAVLALREDYDVSVLAWFGLGLIFSLLMGVASAFAAQRAMLTMTKIRLLTEQGLLAGDPPLKELQAFFESYKLTWKTWVPSYIGVMSFLCFVVGLVAEGLTFA